MVPVSTLAFFSPLLSWISNCYHNSLNVHIQVNLLTVIPIVPMCLKIHTSLWCIHHRTFFENTGLNTCMWNALVSCWHSLQWHHNGRDSVSNHQPHDCLLNRLFRRRSKKTSKLRVTGLCAGNSPVNSQHKWPVTRKMFPFDDVIMSQLG